MNPVSTSDIAATLIASQQEAALTRVSIAMMRQENQQSLELVAMLDRAARSAGPPAAPGTGAIVDKRA